MRFVDFSNYLSRLETLSSRNEITAILSDLIHELKKDEVKNAMYLLQGRVAPQYENIEFSFSDKMIIRALIKYSHKTEVEVNSAYKNVGDIGLLVDELIDNASSKYSINEVFNILKEIPFITGKNSQTFKEQKYIDLISNSTNNEIKFINRILTGKMRLGLSTKTLLDALSWALAGDKSFKSRIEYAYGVRTDLGSIAEFLMENGIDSIDSLHVEPGIPVAPKLVEREKNTAAIFERIPLSIIQPKLDGLRMHIHFKREGFGSKQRIYENQFDIDDNNIEQVRLFSRNLENLTPMFPEIVRAAINMKADSFIIDGEAIGIDKETGDFMPFQETIKRKRKNDVDSMSDTHPVYHHSFDILELNGVDLLNTPNDERVKILDKLIKESREERIVMTETTLVNTESEIQTLFDKYISQNYEGIIIKSPKSLYIPGGRNFDWIKLKGASIEGLSDNVDGVVLGYYVGSGVRTKFGMGAILIGVCDKTNDKFVSLAKVGTGIKDSDFLNMKTELDKIKIDELPKNVEIAKILMPDVIVRPEIVVEVEADMISKSLVHGGVEGYSLRFPRLKYFGRDKNAEDCTSVEEIKRMFELQGNK
jgi:DNA ligase-1